jgi:hypothetical protein
MSLTLDAETSKTLRINADDFDYVNTLGAEHRIKGRRIIEAMVEELKVNASLSAAVIQRAKNMVSPKSAARNVVSGLPTAALRKLATMKPEELAALLANQTDNHNNEDRP